VNQVNHAFPDVALRVNQEGEQQPNPSSKNIYTASKTSTLNSYSHHCTMVSARKRKRPTAWRSKVKRTTASAALVLLACCCCREPAEGFAPLLPSQQVGESEPLRSPSFQRRRYRTKKEAAAGGQFAATATRRHRTKKEAAAGGQFAVTATRRYRTKKAAATGGRFAATATDPVDVASDGETRPQNVELHPNPPLGNSDKGRELSALSLHSLFRREVAFGKAPPASMPPWLRRLEQEESMVVEDIEQEVGWFEYALLERGFSIADTRDIVRSLYSASDGEKSVAAGAIDFCRLLLELEEPDVDDVVTKEVLLASIMHYSDCIVPRRQGLQDIIRSAVVGDNCKQIDVQLPLGNDVSSNDQPQNLVPSRPITDEGILCCSTCESSPLPSPCDVYDGTSAEEEARRIAGGAARLKKAEILSQSIRGDANGDSAGAVSWTPEQASTLRAMLLTITEDWRSLAIRCVACLYRLDGVAQQLQGAASYQQRSPEVIREARTAMRIFAPLSQQLGMHHLHAVIEDRAFQILYRRQYEVVSSMYDATSYCMERLSHYLLEQISNTLRNDDDFMYQIEDLQVTSRVKEPFSFWKKLLKKRGDNFRALKQQPDYGISESGEEGSGSRTPPSPTSSSLVFADVQDIVALRVILKARKLTPDEPDESTRAREQVLCYYAQHLIRSEWPEIRADRLKDYIRFPKPNHYMSLHHTSSVKGADGIEFPFEVQVRADYMHRIAEYGAAAHFDYKLGSPSTPTLLLSPSDDDDEAQTNILPRVQSAASPLGSSSYLDALVTAKQGLMKENVYVFLAGSVSSSGKGGIIISIPPGSRVKDVVAGAREQFGPVEDPTVCRNGKLASMQDTVENGDVFLILE